MDFCKWMRITYVMFEQYCQEQVYTQLIRIIKKRIHYLVNVLQLHNIYVISRLI